MRVVGVVDTTFARVDMAKYAVEVIKSHLPNARIIRYTVPGIKDIPLAAKLILKQADAAITLGWVGPNLVDKISYAVASLGLMMIQLEMEKPIIDVTVHEDEAVDPKKLYEIAVNRAREHALNLVTILTRGYEGLTPFAGKGLRQGLPDVGPLVE